MRLPAAVLLALAFLPAAAAAQTNTLYMKSEPGDYIGAGQTVTYTSGTFSLSGSDRVVTASFSDASHWWYLDFAAPQGQSLAVGLYEGATRYPFNSPTSPGLSVSGDGRGCNELGGRFVIRELVRDGSGAVVQFAADFEQHCEFWKPALYGAIRKNSSVPISPVVGVGDTTVGEGPGALLKFKVSLSLPAVSAVTVSYATADGTAVAGTDYLAVEGALTIPAGATSGEVAVETYDDAVESKRVLYLDLTEAAGAPIVDPRGQGTILDDEGPQTFFILDSTPGDWVGGGRYQKLTTADGAFSAGMYGSATTHLGFDGDTWWDFYGVGPGNTAVAVGAYENAARWPFQTSQQPGLDFSGDGRGCNQLSGRFDVLEVVRSGSAITSFAVDFVQYCETWMPPLYGSLRFNSRVPPPAPVTYSLHVDKSGAGSGAVASQPSGISCGTDCDHDWTRNTRVTLTATAGQDSVFAGWWGACGGTGTCSVLMSAARSVTATFVRTFPLTVTRAGGGAGLVTSEPAGISCGAACSASYVEGTSVTLAAAAQAGSYFAGWSGACRGAEPTAVVVVDAAKSCVASFAPKAKLQFGSARLKVAENAGFVLVPVTRSGNLTNAVDVGFATVDGTAEAPGDFAARTERLTFAAGATQATARVNVVNDTLVEGWELLHLRLFDPSSGAVLGEASDASVLITDDELRTPAVFFAEPDHRVAEGGNAELTLRRSGSLERALNVTVVTTAATALGEIDFTPSRQVVRFAAGQSAATVRIPTLADELAEGTETFFVEALPATTAGTQRRTTVSILDASDPGSVVFMTPVAQTGESRGTFDALLERTGDLTGEAYVWYATRPETAVESRDFEPVWTSAYFPPGVRRAVASVKIIGDDRYDGPESFVLSLWWSNLSIGTQREVVVHIRDDE